jgi:N-acetylated-alpha-linked acidic dipeptidase
VSPPTLSWEAKLEEEDVYHNPTPQQQQTLSFHGLSKSGNVTGPLIYANYGSKTDFKSLADSGIDVTGSIALVRYGGDPSDRAGKVKAAQDAGAIGCLIYSDPKDDGFLNGEVWPNGPYRTSDSVERGSVALTSYIVGDVLTPGEGSLSGAKRISKEDNPGLVKIPSLPLAWRDAQRLLQVLKGHGQQVTEEWKGGVPDVEEWWTGDKFSPQVYLQNDQEEVDTQRIYNVLGRIEGMETWKKTIFVGNHRDSWCFGSVDPGSGTAVMLEIVNVLGKLKAQGWQPLRSIVFASWDAEEYNLIGSTEYVEHQIKGMRENGIAYINVDVGVSGSLFQASGSPLFKKTLMKVLNRVSDPIANKTLKALWEEAGNDIEGLGAGSDYVAFQDLAGCSSIDIGFQGGPYPYHSCYETYEWMEKFGDPGFVYHKLLAEVWVLLIIELAQQPLIPFDFEAYPQYIKRWVQELDEFAGASGAPWSGDDAQHDKSKEKWDIGPLVDAAEKFEKDAREFQAWEDFWSTQVYGTGGLEASALRAARVSHNTRMSNFETHLLDVPGGYGDDIGAKVPEGRVYGVSHCVAHIFVPFSRTHSILT